MRLSFARLRSCSISSLRRMWRNSSSSSFKDMTVRPLSSSSVATPVFLSSSSTRRSRPGAIWARSPSSMIPSVRWAAETAAIWTRTPKASFFCAWSSFVDARSLDMLGCVETLSPIRSQGIVASVSLLVRCGRGWCRRWSRAAVGHAACSFALVASLIRRSIPRGDTPRARESLSTAQSWVIPQERMKLYSSSVYSHSSTCRR